MMSIEILLLLVIILLHSTSSSHIEINRSKNLAVNDREVAIVNFYALPRSSSIVKIVNSALSSAQLSSTREEYFLAKITQMEHQHQSRIKIELFKSSMQSVSEEQWCRSSFPLRASFVSILDEDENLSDFCTWHTWWCSEWEINQGQMLNCYRWSMSKWMGNYLSFIECFTC